VNQPSVIGKAVPARPGEWRDPAVFGPLDARVVAEVGREKEARSGKAKRESRAVTRAGNAGTGSRHQAHSTRHRRCVVALRASRNPPGAPVKSRLPAVDTQIGP
jgi:hypothetical protein